MKISLDFVPRSNSDFVHDKDTIIEEGQFDLGTNITFYFVNFSFHTMIFPVLSPETKELTSFLLQMEETEPEWPSTALTQVSFSQK